MPQYEFSQSDNVLLRDLGRKMRGVGAFLCLVGVLYLFASGSAFLHALRGRGNVVPGVVHLLAAVISLAIGLWTAKAGKSFQRIVQSAGQDIPHLMDALGNLKKMYSLSYTLILICLVLLVAILVGGAVLYWVTPGPSA